MVFNRKSSDQANKLGEMYTKTIMSMAESLTRTCQMPQMLDLQVVH